MAKLPNSFYVRKDVVRIARDLLGKYLFTRIDGKLTGGMITETEAYAGPIDRASHAYGGRRTPRNEMLYAPGGRAYVYFCYGLHHLFNVVTYKEGVPHAVLVRALKPLVGVETMLKRRHRKTTDKRLTSGPAMVSQALGISTKAHNGEILSGKMIWLEDRGVRLKASQISSGPRIGVDYAGPHARWPYRFWIKDGNGHA